MAGHSSRAVVQLVCGVVAGPVLLAVLLVDGATRPGYDQWRNGFSQLVLGERGWLARLVFLGCGVAMLACAIGLRQVMRGGTGAVWGLGW